MQRARVALPVAPWNTRSNPMKGKGYTRPPLPGGRELESSTAEEGFDRVGVWIPGMSGSRLQGVCLGEAQPPGTDLGNRTIPVISPKGWMDRRQDGASKGRVVLKTSKKETGRQSLDKS